MRGEQPVVMVTEPGGSFYAQLASGVRTALEDLGVPLLLHFWGLGRTPPRSLVRLLEQGRPRAVMIAPLGHPDSDAQLADLLADRPGLPVLRLGVAGGACSVRADNAMGMRLVAEHLIRDCAARRLLVVRGIGHHVDSREREEAIVAELSRLGVADDRYRIIDGLFSREDAYRAVRQALGQDPAIDAVAAFNDRSALGAVDAIRSLGLRVPEDVVVAGFDDEEFASLCRPGLTTVSQEPRQQGLQAGLLVGQLLAGQRPGHVRVPVRLAVRTSTGRGWSVPPADHARNADLLWGQVAGLDAALAKTRRLMSCRTVEQVAEELSAGLPMLGAIRGFLLLHDPDPDVGGGGRVISVHEGKPRWDSSVEHHDLAGWLPEHLHEHQLQGTLLVQPLAVGDVESGYLVLEQAPGTDHYLPEALALDLSRALDSINRTHRLEAEVSARRTAQEALVYQARHDPLTGLLNRTAFLSMADLVLARCADAGAALAVVDVDRFKDVNDSLGHTVGDALLREVGARLATLTGPDGVVARLGGDEFAVLTPGAGRPDRAMAVADIIVAALRDHFALDGVDLEIEASVGVAHAPQQASDATALLRMADIAMYQAKSEHCGATCYDPTHAVETPHRLALFGELRRALAQQELTVHYQPIIDVATGLVGGVEALVRWEHPVRGMVQPGDFLEIAEQTGLIQPITTYVLDRALRDCRTWLDQGLSLITAVNLSTRRLMDATLPLEVGRLLERHRIPSSHLVLEVTESAAMADPLRALSVLRGLRALGIDLSVDDFGTGHASLAYLSRLPVSSLKIDRSFVQSMESDRANMTIVRSILDLARNLRLEVIAEGVETSSAYRALAELGGTLAALGGMKAQGYWLARPVPAGQIPTVIAEIESRLGGGTGDGSGGGTGVPQPRGGRDAQPAGAAPRWP